MEFWFILFLIFLFILILPYIRSIIKRVSMVCKLKNVCKKQRLKLYPTHLFWMLGSRHGSACDFYIEGKSVIYSVKLFGVTCRSPILVFTEAREYYFRYLIVFISYSVLSYSFNGKKKKFKDYDFRKKFRTEWEIKTPRNILLINPVCREIRYQTDRSEERIVGGGEFIYNCEIESLSRLISDWEFSHE